jgi:hypothetical protein
MDEAAFGAAAAPTLADVVELAAILFATAG